MTRHRILLVGATGVFGGRLARQLARINDVALIVTSRDLARAEALASKLRVRRP
jgi:short-subunit dehydrogenase